MMNDPTAKWTQQSIRNIAAVKDRRDISLTLNFVDDMMRLKDDVYTAKRAKDTVHYYATKYTEPITYDIYNYINEEASRFRAAVRGVEHSATITYVDKVFNLKLNKGNTEKLLTMLRAVDKYIVSLRKDPQNDKDFKKIIHKHVEWKWNK
jgi:hypothetical protein